MRKQRGKILAISMSIALFASCKAEETTSSEKTLDDFASGGSVNGPNSCGEKVRNEVYTQLSVIKDPGSSLTDKQLQEYRPTVEQYFSALPEEYAKYYVEKLKGIVVLTDDAQFEAICTTGQGLTPERQKEMGTCYAYQQEGPNQAKLAIVHRVSTDSKADNLARIRTGGIRSIGMVFAQFLARHEINNDQLDKGINVRYRDNDVSKEVAALKKELASRFLADVAKSAGKYKMSTFAPILGKGLSEQAAQEKIEGLAMLAHSFAAHVESGKTAEGADLLGAAKIDSANKQQFLDYVFAEAFDSAFCSLDTLASAEKNFPMTMGDDTSDRVFQRLEAALKNHTDDLATHFLGSDTSSILTADAFGLQSGGCQLCNGSCCSGGQCNCVNGQCTCAGGSCNCTNCGQQQTQAMQDTLAKAPLGGGVAQAAQIGQLSQGLFPLLQALLAARV